MVTMECKGTARRAPSKNDGAPLRQHHCPVTLETDYCRITLNKRGADEYTKISYPLKYGIYSEIETRDAILQFNLNHEIVRAKGKDRQWIQPSEWLKRSMGNDWIYYSTGGYTGVFEAIGEYYLPNLPYPTNALIGGKPFLSEPVQRIVTSWHAIIETALESVRQGRQTDSQTETKADKTSKPVQCPSAPSSFSLSVTSPSPSISGKEDSDINAILHFLESALRNSPDALEMKAKKLFDTIGGRISVMPPDARHVDYDIVPLPISEGCLYKCKFCRIKSDHPFRVRSLYEIDETVTSLKEIYRNDLVNYRGIFLGDHDALNAGKDAILYGARAAYEGLGMENGYMKGDAALFMFGSVDALMKAPVTLFDELNRLPFRTYINIGLESANQATLDRLGKPITAGQVRECFFESQKINAQFDKIEITLNFIMDDHLPEGHYPAFLDLVREGVKRPQSKGSVYLSPLRIDQPSRSVLFDFNRLKRLSRLPTYLYIIQRL